MVGAIRPPPSGAVWCADEPLERSLEDHVDPISEVLSAWNVSFRAKFEGWLVSDMFAASEG